MSSIAFLWGIPQGAAGPERGVETPNRMTSCAETAPGAKAMSAAALSSAAHIMARCDLMGPSSTRCWSEGQAQADYRNVDPSLSMGDGCQDACEESQLPPSALRRS